MKNRIIFFAIISIFMAFSCYAAIEISYTGTVAVTGPDGTQVDPNGPIPEGSTIVINSGTVKVTGGSNVIVMVDGCRIPLNGDAEIRIDIDQKTGIKTVYLISGTATMIMPDGRTTRLYKQKPQPALNLGLRGEPLEMDAQNEETWPSTSPTT